MASKIQQFLDHDATANKFVSFAFGQDSMWSLDPVITGGAGGTAKYTIYASNHSLLEADMKPYRIASTDVPIAEQIDSESFRFLNIGIKYTAGDATGILNIFIEKKLDK